MFWEMICNTMLTLLGNKVWTCFLTTQLRPLPTPSFLALSHLSPFAWHPRPLAWSYCSAPSPHFHTHPGFTSHTRPFVHGPTSRPLPMLFHLLGTHLLPTTVCVYHKDESLSFESPKFYSTSFKTHFVLLCLGSSPYLCSPIGCPSQPAQVSGSHVLLYLPHDHKLHRDGL